MPNRERLLELALKGLQADRAKLDDEIAQIKSELNHSSAAPTAAHAAPAAKKRTMSAAARKRISEGMKRRYAELKKAARR